MSMYKKCDRCDLMAESGTRDWRGINIKVDHGNYSLDLCDQCAPLVDIDPRKTFMAGIDTVVARQQRPLEKGE